MGGGYWRREDFTAYSRIRGRTVRRDGHIDTSKMRGAQDMYQARQLDPQLNPYKVNRECCDSREHPETVPVILALDVTGSMGGACLKTAASLNVIMQNILDEYRDVEFMVMGIGDLAYDKAPIQISQFESDIRIAEQLDKIWFERGGGGNSFESYTAAWYMGLYHTSLDYEPLNPYLPAEPLANVTGDSLQGDVETRSLYREALQKFEIFHIAIDDREDCYSHYESKIKGSFGRLLKDRFFISTLDRLPETILKCLRKSGVRQEKDAVPTVAEAAKTDTNDQPRHRPGEHREFRAEPGEYRTEPGEFRTGRRPWKRNR